MRKIIALGILGLLTLSGCIDSMSLQRNYVGDRDYCRQDSESKMSTYTAPLNEPVSGRERNGMLLTLFSECMRARDWAVAGPKKDKPKEPVPPIETARAPEQPIFISVPDGAAAAPAPAVNYYVFAPDQQAAPPPPPPPKPKPVAKKRKMSVPRKAEDSNCNENSANQTFIDTYYATPAPNISAPLTPGPAPASAPAKAAPKQTPAPSLKSIIEE